MANQSLQEVLEQLEKALKEKPNYNKLPGGSGYRNGYEDGFKLVVKRFKTFRDALLNAPRED
jgi:hypothetical protein